MKRWKWKKIVVGAAIVMVFLAGIAYWAMNKAVDKVLHAISTDALIASMANPSPVSLPENSPVSSDTGEIPLTPFSSPINTQPEASAVPSAEASKPNGGAKGSTDKLNPSPTPVASTSYIAEIDAAKAEKAQEEITLKDKLQVTSIFLKRFNAKELDAFSKLASGGLSVEDKVEAKKLVLQKLSEDEYNQLIAIAAKLGLSQGKNYEESTKEFTD